MRKFSKKVMAVLCAVLWAVALIVMSFGGFGSAYADTKPEKKPAVAVNYKEVPDKYRAAMKRAVEMGLITPDEKQGLRPNDIMTIAEYATVLHKAHGWWFGKQEADHMKLLRGGKITIDCREPSEHWAYVPLYYVEEMNYTTHLLDTVKYVSIVDNEEGESNLISYKPVTEILLYITYGRLSPLMCDFEQHDNVFKNKCDKDDIVEENFKNFIQSYMAYARSDSKSLWSVYLRGIQVMQSAGLIPLKADGLELNPARQITRAEMIYTFMSLDDYARSQGCKGMFYEGVDKLRAESYHHFIDVIKKQPDLKK